MGSEETDCFGIRKPLFVCLCVVKERKGEEDAPFLNLVSPLRLLS